MTKARKDQVSLEATPFYHCYVRCVRRAYLCGDDYLTGENYDHRKQWIVSRLRFLSYIYAIDLCAYAVMSNHYHVVLHVDKIRAEGWSKEEVVERWMQLYKGDVLVNRWLQEGDGLDRATLEKVDEIIEKWRERLYSLEWFMRGVNETIARMANEEEGCKGRFWEGRYKSQALLDETALLSCMAYVDLNPVRAGMEESLSDSDFTSIQQRLYDYAIENNKRNKLLKQRVHQQQQIKTELELDHQPEAPLMRFDGSSHTPINAAIPFTREDYFDLVDQTGRMIRDDKRGFIPKHIPKLITQFNINPDQWINHIRQFGRRYADGVGSVEKLADYAGHFQKRWVKGVACSKKVYALQAC